MPVVPARTRRRACRPLATVALGAAVIATALAAAGPAAATTAPTTVTVTSCTEQALRAAVAAVPDGGTVDFGCDGDIPITGSRIVTPHSLTIDGSGHSVTFDGQGTTALIENDGPNSLTLRNLTLAGGADLTSPYSSGGAVFSSGPLTVANVDFVDNFAYAQGGAIWASGRVQIRNSTFQDNDAQVQGGAIALMGPFTASIADSTFTGNMVTCSVNGAGGGAVVTGPKGSLAISGSTFANNLVNGSNAASGGAILAGRSTVLGMSNGIPAAPYPSGAGPAPVGGPLSIADTTFTGNEVTMQFGDDGSSHYGGGAVASLNHPLTVSRATFTDNVVGMPVQAEGAALLVGAYSTTSAPATITDSTFTDNVFAQTGQLGLPLSGVGGGVAVVNASTTVTSSTFTRNHAAFGGGLSDFGAPMSVQRSTFADNLAGRQVTRNVTDYALGGALTTNAPVVLTATRMTGNTPGTCDVFGPLGSVTLGRGTTDDAPGSCTTPAAPQIPFGARGLSAKPGHVTAGATVTLTARGFGGFALTRVTAYPRAHLFPRVDLRDDQGAPSYADVSGLVSAQVVAPSTPGVYYLVVSGVEPHGRGLRAVLGTLTVRAAAGGSGSTVRRAAVTVRPVSQPPHVG